MTGILEAALAYAARGWPVFPCAPGTKIPAIKGGRGVLDATTDPGQITAWWDAMPDANVAIATGAPGPDVIDVDVKDGAEYTGYAAFKDAAQSGLAAGAGTYVQTPSGGLHAYYQGTSQRNGRIPGRHLDFRATGGYVVAAPSIVDSKPYQVLLEDGTPGPADWHAIRALLEPPPDPAVFQQPARPASEAVPDLVRPGDDWATHTTWAQILKQHGWRQVRELGGGRACWCRPGKTGPFTSATTREDGGLYVFSTSTPFDVEVPYSKFGAYALLEHGGDHKAAAAQLRRDGFGAPEPAITFTQPAPPTPGGEEEQPEHTSWHPRDLGPVLAGDESGDPKPVFLYRDDGACLVYRAKINALIGESESGKTWIALLAVVQAIGGGGQALYLDFEDAPAGITGRLLALGLTRAQLAAQFRYVAPDEPLTGPAAADLSTALAAPVPDLIVLDGVNAAMTMLGLNLKDNKDATDFSQRILRPLKRTGAAVLTVDHVTKDREGRGNYAIGAQAKRADIDGAAFLVEVIKPFGRGLTGKLRMTVSKDRPGHVRAISAGARNAGTAILTSRPDGGIDATIENPDMRPAGERPPWRPTGIMERVSRFLEEMPEGVSTKNVELNVKGKAEHKRVALDQLAAEGYVTRQAGQRGAIIHVSAKPYREISEQQIPPRPHVVPTSSPGPGTRSSAGPADVVPRTPSVTSSQGGRDEVGRTVAQDELTGLTSSPGATP